jgi:hypothetical protein
LTVTSNNNYCNTITTKQTISTDPTYPGTAHAAITFQTPGVTNSKLQVVDNTMPQVI